MTQASTPLRAFYKSGFTLVEVLVVIAIIAILASILFPVFAQARDKARQTACLSNQRQIGMGFLQYFQDNDEQFPHVKGEAPWILTVQPYLKSTRILRCPNDNSALWGDAVKPRSTSYTLNGYLAPGNSKPEQGGNFPSIAAIQKPASVIFLAESAKTFGGSYFHAHVWNPPTSPSHWLADKNVPDDIDTVRHAGGFNATYLDGHAKWAKFSQVWWRDEAVMPPLKGNFDPRQQ